MLNFIITVILVYLLYYIVYIRKYDNYGKLKAKYKEEKIPAEAELVLKKVRLNREKINYKAFLKLVALTSAIDIAIIVAIIDLLPFKLTIKFLIAFGMMFPIIYISYNILARYILKKGGLKDEGK